MYSIIKKDKSAYFAGFTKKGKARFTQDIKKAYSATLREAKTQAGLHLRKILKKLKNTFTR